MKLGKEIIRKMSGEITEAVQDVAKKYGVTIAGGGGRFGDLEATIKLKITTVGDDGQTKAQRDFLEIAVLDGFKKEDLGKVIPWRKGEMKIVGYNPGRPKFGIEAEDVRTGKNYLLPTDIVLRKLGRKTQEVRS